MCQEKPKSILFRDLHDLTFTVAAGICKNAISIAWPYHLICETEWEVGNLVPDSAAAAGELVAGRCDNDTTHKLRPDSGPRLRQRLIIDGSKGPGLASNCITGHFSIAICESCGDVCRVAINRHRPEMQSLPLSHAFSLSVYMKARSLLKTFSFNIVYNNNTVGILSFHRSKYQLQSKSLVPVSSCYTH